MNLSPLPIQKFFDNNGRPMAGGLLFTYAAGTTTKVSTYPDSAGGTPNTNPIVLDFRGECRLWINPLLAYKFILAPPGDSDPPTSPIWTVDNITAAPLPFDNTAVDTGSVNNISLTITQITSPVAFTRVVFEAANTNTGPTTLQINGGTAAALVLQNIGAFSGGEIQAGGIYQAVFDGAVWQLLGPCLQPTQIRAALEISNGITPVNYWHPVGHVLRYANNTVPGTTDMTLAFQRAALSSATPYAPAGIYLITDTILFQNNQHWLMNGARINITGNTIVFSAGVGINDWSIRGPWKVTGDNDDSGSLSGLGAAIDITDSMRWSIGAGLTASNIRGFGVRCQSGASVSLRAEHGVIDSPQVYACTTGMAFEAGTQPGAEYITVNGPLITRCGIGMYVQAGNLNVNGGTITDNDMNVRINAGANAAHGTFTGTHINHPTGTYAIYASNVTPGFTFNGCHIFEGSIWLEGCAAMVFEGGVIAPSDIINDTGVLPLSSWNYFIANYWALGYATQVNSNNGGEYELIITGGFGPGLIDINTGISVNTPSIVYAGVRRAPASTQSLTTGTPATLVFNSASDNRRNAYNTTTGVFEVPTAQEGIYRILANLIFSGTAMSSTSSVVALQINGASVAVFLPSINSTTALSVIIVSDQYLEVGDEITLVGTITGTTPLFGHASFESRLQIEKIS